jgi:hypothetical protein
MDTAAMWRNIVKISLFSQSAFQQGTVLIRYNPEGELQASLRTQLPLDPEKGNLFINLRVVDQSTNLALPQYI